MTRNTEDLGIDANTGKPFDPLVYLPPSGERTEEVFASDAEWEALTAHQRRAVLLHGFADEVKRRFIEAVDQMTGEGNWPRMAAVVLSAAANSQSIIMAVPTAGPGAWKRLMAETECLHDRVKAEMLSKGDAGHEGHSIPDALKELLEGGMISGDDEQPAEDDDHPDGRDDDRREASA